jgi:peptidoglycan/LPS O-acetylase OafA/YrhL
MPAADGRMPAEAEVGVFASPSRGRSSSFAGGVLSHLSRETTSGRFIPEMDGLRFVAIGMVFLFHLNGYLIVKSASLYTFSQRDLLEQTAAVGFRGVELFFVISGFILGLPFAAHYIGGAKRVNLRKYYLRRLTRLEPPYIVTTLVLFVLGLVLRNGRFTDLYRHLAASLLYQHDVIYGTMSPVIGVAWSLEIEVQFYLLVPVLTLLFAVQSAKRRRVWMIGLILAILALQPLLLPGHPRLSLSILAYLQFFLVGFLLADVFLVEWKQVPQHSYKWDLIALAGWPLLFVILHFALARHWLFPLFILILYVAAFRGRLFNRFFASPWITVIGGMCYSIYLIHYEVISAVARFTRPWSEGAPYWLHLVFQSALVGSAVVVVCGAYFLLLEKPCMRPDWPQRVWVRLTGTSPAQSPQTN